MPEKTKEIIGAGNYLKLIRRNGYEQVDRVGCTGIVVILPITPNDELVLVEQYRIPLDTRVIELPAGLVSDKGNVESMEDAAHRELLEETGFEAASMKELATWPTSSGTTSERVTLFEASGLTRKTDGGGDPTERITVHLAPLGEAAAWLANAARDNRALIDPKIYAALYLRQSLSRNP